MSWTTVHVFDLIEIDLVKLAPTALKSAAGAIGGGVAGVLFRKVKGWIMPVSERCMITVCGAAASTDTKMRGLCLKCYGQAKKKVEAGETTWEALASLGLCKSAETLTPFDIAFKEAQRVKDSEVK